MPNAYWLMPPPACYLLPFGRKPEYKKEVLSMKRFVSLLLTLALVLSLGIVTAAAATEMSAVPARWLCNN